MSTTELVKFNLHTSIRDFIDITDKVREAIDGLISEKNLNQADVEGSVLVFCPYTTAAISLNENTDPDVQHDIFFGFDRAFPPRQEFKHAEGNSPAHLKNTVTGCSETIIIHEGKMLLGVFQAIYLCEFDGPRNRTIYAQIHLY
jgi:secondary thiamine-phosphate synthase enzyme